MRKMKSILGILILSIGILGTGYAYWCDTLTAEATVKTGEFDVDFDSLKAFGSCDDAQIRDKGSDKISLNTGELVPGSFAFFNMGFKNKEEMKAKLVDVSIGDMHDGHDSDRSGDKRTSVDYFVGMSGMWYHYVGDIKDIDNKIEWMYKHFYDENGGLEKGKTMSIRLVPFMPYENKSQGGQNQECKFDINFEWGQDDCTPDDMNESRTMAAEEELVLITDAQFEEQTGIKISDLDSVSEVAVSEDDVEIS